MSKEQFCPVCNEPVKVNPRYPNYVCNKDVERTTDSTGKPVIMSNTGMGGGFIAKYVDGSNADQVNISHIVLIDGAKFHADEAYFGGIVVTPAQD